MSAQVKGFYDCKLGVSLALQNLIADKKGAYKNSYASLPNTLEVVVKLYAENGLVFSQLPYHDGDLVLLRTRITCAATGEFEESVLPVGKFPFQDSQKLGSALSYARRFSLQCCALVAPDETLEDDGEAVKGIPIPAPPPKKPEPVIEMMSEAESSEARKKFMAQLAEITTRAQLKAWSKDTKPERDRMTLEDQSAIRTEFNNIDADTKG